MPEQTFIRFELPNGVNVHVYPTGKFKTTTIRLFLHHQLNEDDLTLNALYPNVLRRGTRHLPTTRDLARQLESLYGARASVDVTKRGDDHIVSIGVDAIDDYYVPGGGKLLCESMRLLRDLVADPLVVDGAFKPEYVEGEKEIVRRDIEGLINDKATYAAWRCVEEALRGDPYALLPVGRLEDLPGITPQGLYEYYRRSLATDPIDIYIVGDVTPEPVIRAIEERLAVPRQSAAPRPQMNVPRGEGRERIITESQDICQAKLVMVALPGINLADPRYHALVVYNGILGGFPHSKLFRNVREKASLCYYATSGIERAKGLLLIQCGIDSEKFEPAMDIIRDQIRAIAAGEITDDELDFTKRALMTRLQMTEDSPGQIVAQHLDGVICGRPLVPADERADIARVSRDDVVAVAREIKLDTIYLLRPERGER
ncbi:MAG: EF-P 5-aminopentanol modification-associated protein YfmF [Chloroflexota bacterium]